jgi:hypothetical protein
MRDALLVRMRRFYLTGSFFALLVALCALWTYRFERVSGFPTWQLADLRVAAPTIVGVEWLGAPDQPSLRLKVDEANPRVAVRLAIPGSPAVEMLHLHFQMSANGLIPGREEWEDGRAMIEWHETGEGTGRENDPVGSVRHDERIELSDFVVYPLHAPAVPTLRLEHLGQSGEFDLSHLEITVVSERSIWKTGRWFLMCAWLVWGVACVRSWPAIPWRRAILASAIWVFMGIQFVVPGPWKNQRSMVSAFRLGNDSSMLCPGWSSTAGRSVIGGISARPASGSVAALGKIPDRGSFVLRVKHRIQQARPLLHALLFFAPTLVLLYMIGRNATWPMMGIQALAVEAAQIGFGYGFDWVDVADLITDAIGIALAIWLYGLLKERRQRRAYEPGFDA